MNHNIEEKPTLQPEEQEIDLMELARKVWAERRLIIKCCLVAAVVGLVVAFSIPKEYATSVTIAPEADGKSSTGGVGALAAMAGVNLGSGGSGDALSPELYPDIVSSTPFLVELFTVEVEGLEQESKLSLYNYLYDHQQSAWWSTILGAPFKLLGWVSSLVHDKEAQGESGLNPFMLTKDEEVVAQALNNRIAVSVDKKTGITTLTVTMQDPLISAVLTDTVLVRLQNYITTYRTTKARKDLEFTEKLYQDAQADYYDAQQKYALYADENQNVLRRSSRTEMERLQNEMNLRYSVYNQVAQQLQMARAKVQEITPVFTVVQPATVPLKAAKPKKALILIGFVFLAGVGSVAWVLFGKDFISCLKVQPQLKQEQE